MLWTHRRCGKGTDAQVLAAVLRGEDTEVELPRVRKPALDDSVNRSCVQTSVSWWDGLKDKGYTRPEPLSDQGAWDWLEASRTVACKLRSYQT